MYKKGIAIVLLFGSVCFAQNPDSAIAKGQHKTTLNVDFTYKEIPKSVQKGKSITIEITDDIVPKNNKLAAVSDDNADTTGNTYAVFSVSPSGAATYAVPFSTPPGIKNIQPNLGLAYNSQSGNGLAGWGWSISGLSTLIRISSTGYHDGIIDPIDFDTYDRYALDGQRLILKSGTYGADASVYQTENYSNLKIVAHRDGIEAAGPSYFTVHYPDGSTAWYGKESAKGTLEWALQRKEDVHGNYITYEYLESDAVLRIHKVNYGSNHPNPTLNTIQFFYKERYRKNASYVGGHYFRNKYLLDKVKIFSTGKLYRKYQLKHDYTTLFYFNLDAIQEYNKEGDFYSPIKFKYKSANRNIPTKRITSDALSTVFDYETDIIFGGEFDGDGQSDIISYNKESMETLKMYTKTFDDDFTVLRTYNMEEPFEKAFASTSLSCEANKKIAQQNTLTTISHVLENKTLFKNYEITTNGSIVSCKDRYWNDVPRYYSKPSYSSPFKLNRKPHEYLSGDFDGDGLTDVLAVGKAYEYKMCILQNNMFCETNTMFYKDVYYIDLNTDLEVAERFSGKLNNPVKFGDQLKTADFNGDGKMDIFHFTEGSVHVYGINESKNIFLLTTYSHENIDLEYPILLGDYNGDGKTDFMIPTANDSYDWLRCDSDGILFNGNVISSGVNFKHNYAVNGNEYNFRDPLYEFNYIPQDFDGDGKTDILRHHITTSEKDNKSLDKVILYSNMDNAFGEQFKLLYAYHVYTDSGVTKYGRPLILDASTSNSNQEYAFLSGKDIYTYEFQNSHQEEMTLEEITNNEVVSSISYTAMNGTENSKAVYTPDTSEVYPYVNSNIVKGIQLVNKVTQAAPGVTQTQEFKYKGLVHHIGGLGSLGFKTLKRSNWYGDGVQPLWNISKHSPQYRGALLTKWLSTDADNYASDYIQQTDYTYETSLYTNPSSELYPHNPFPQEIIQNESINDTTDDRATWRILLQPGFHVKATNTLQYHARITEQDAIEYPGAYGYAGVFKRTLKSAATHNALKGINTTNQYTYTDYLKPKKIKTTFPGGSIAKTFTYLNNPSAVGHDYYIGRLEKYIEKKILGKESFKTTTKLTYKNNLIKTQKKKGKGTEWAREDYTYDTFGNLLTKTLKTTGMSDRTQYFSYDESGRFLIKSSDIEGLTTGYTYDTNNGNQLSVKNPYGLTTSYSYDTWGRMKSETNYLNQTTTYAYEVSNIDGDWRLEKKITTPDGGISVSYYNALGWILKTKAMAFNEKEVFKEFEYDAIGRKVRESEPYFDRPKHWNQWAYDHYGRLQSQSSFTGKVVTSEYEGLQTTVDDGDKSVSSIQDALGNVTQITDPGGTLEYVYHANGSLKETVYGDHVVSTEIDGWGRKIKLSDPSAGAYTYNYNGFGEITTETTPLGKTTFTYDATGKLTEKSIEGKLTDLTLSYTYDSNSKLLQEITGFDGIEDLSYNYAYTYDSYKRPLKIKETTAQADFEKTLEYDSLGRIKEVAHHTLHHASALTADQEIVYVYDSNGIMGELKDANTQASLWKITQENERGQATNIVLGNGMIRENTFDNFGFLQSIRDVTDDAVALELDYVFDVQKGNLTQRTNLSFEDWTENFTYDNQNRLTEIKGATTHSQSYDLSGKIQENTRVGAYNYRKDKMYQLSEIDLNAQGAMYYQNHAPQTITYNAFKKPVHIQEVNKGSVDFTYGPLLNRTHAYYGGVQEEKTERRYHKLYSSLFPIEIIEDHENNTVKTISYIQGDAYTAPIAHIKQTGSNAIDEYHYLHRDYLGSILAITDSAGGIKEQRQFGAWGQVDGFVDYTGNTTFNHSSLIGRGYTGHEHFFEVSLIHMNGRMYDANLGRFLSPDNHMQDPFNSQNFNRYSYVLNNPLSYVDWSGESFWKKVWNGFKKAGLFVLKVALLPIAIATNATYEIMKYISPIAFKINVHFGTHVSGIGFDVSVGVPKIVGASYRKHYGASYYTKYYGGYKGWETREGYERSYLWFYHEGTTKYTAGEFSQTVGFRKFGIPSVLGIDSENDYWGDGGDRYRSSSTSLNFFGISLRLRTFTGDPGLKKDDRRTDIIDGNETYIKGPYGDPDRYRHGILSLQIGVFEIGSDSESIRHLFQNELVHSYLDSPYFRNDRDRKNRFFFQFGSVAW